MPKTLLLAALTACDPSPEAPPMTTDAEKADANWAGVPLQRGTWPAWAPAGATKEENVAVYGDGRRFAWRVMVPSLDVPEGGQLRFGGQGDVWSARQVDADGTERTLEITLRGTPAYLHGTPELLQPNHATFLGRAEPGEVEGILDLGHEQFTVRCTGPGASLAADGWCRPLLSQVWAETWEG